MKKLFTLCLAAAAVLTSCQYDDGELWDAVNEHEQRLKQLEAQAVQMNNQITALNALVGAVEDADWITGVTPLPDGDGYTITFRNSDPITIRNGENGSGSGEGSVVDIQEIDGVYYWTVDGELLTDADGNYLPVSGKDAVAPQIRINEDTLEWEISTDGGTTWESTGVVAGGEGEGGTGTDNIFSSVDTSNPNYVTFRLANGTSFTVPRTAAPTLTFTGLTNNTFEFAADGETYTIPYTVSSNVTSVGVTSAIPTGWTVNVNESTKQIEVSSTVEESQLRILVAATASDGGNAMQWITLTTTTAPAAPVDPANLQAAIDAAVEGDVITLAAGTVNLTAPIEVNKAITIKGADAQGTVFNVSGAGVSAFMISSAATLDGLSITKSDLTASDLIWVTAADATVQNSNIVGPVGANDDYDPLVRTFMVNSGLTFTFTNNYVENFTNPSYLEGPVTVTNNHFVNVRGFVVTNNYDIVMTGNRALQSEGCICLLDVIENVGYEGDLSIYNDARMQELHSTNNNAQVLIEIPNGLMIEEDGNTVRM